MGTENARERQLREEKQLGKHKSTKPCLLARLLCEPEGMSINLEKIFVSLRFFFTAYLPFRASVWRKAELLNRCCFFSRNDEVFLFIAVAREETCCGSALGFSCTQML